MFSLWVEAREDERDLLIANLWDAGATGITEEDSGALRAFLGQRANGRRLPGSSVSSNPSFKKRRTTTGSHTRARSGGPFLLASGFSSYPSGSMTPHRRGVCDW